MNLIDKIDPSYLKNLEKIEKVIDGFFFNQTILMIALFTFASLVMLVIIMSKMISIVKFSSMKRSMLKGLLQSIEKKSILITPQEIHTVK